MKGLSAFVMLLCLSLGLSAQTVQSQNFNSCTLPGGWTQQVLSGTDGWLFVLNSPDIFNAGNFDGTCMVMFDDDFLGTIAAPSEVALLSPAIDLTSYGSVNLEFDYNFREADAFTSDSFAVDVFDGSSWVNVLGGIDNDCGAWSCGPAYPHANIDVTPYINANFQVRFYYNDMGSSAWWFAFDNFKLTVPSTDDLSLANIYSPTVSTCATSMQTVVVEIENVGSAVATGFDVCFEFDGPGPPFSVCENVGSLSLAPGATTTYTFSTPASLPAGGTYDFLAYVDLTGDTENSNDTVATTIFTSTGSYPLPTSDDFNAYADGNTTLGGNLFNSTADELEWEVNYGGTSSISTGPNNDVTGGGGYLYIESSGSANGDQAILQTGCFDVGGLISPVLEFSYHMYGSSIEGLYVDAHTAGGIVNLATILGQQHGSSFASYSDTVIDLSPFSGEAINVVFRGVIKTDGGGFTYNGDMALDNIEIRAFGNDDLSATEILRPKGEGCVGTASEQVRMRISNVGTDPQTGFNVCYHFDGPTGMSSVCENVGSLTIAGGGGTDTYTFGATVDMSIEGDYHLQVYTDLVGDLAPGNDSLGQDYSFASTVLPVSDNFASYSSGTTNFTSELINDDGDDLNWQVNFGGTSSGGTGPSGDATGLGGYIFVESTGSDSADLAILRTSCIDLTSAISPKLDFSYHMFGGAIGSLSVDVTHGSTTTNELLLVGQQQTSSGAPWNDVTIDLSGYIGEIIRISWTAEVTTDISGATFTSDFGLDEIAVTDPLPNDIGISSVNGPNSNCGLSNSETIAVTLENYGTTPATGFDVVYKVDGPAGSTTVSENIGALVLAAGTTVNYNFATAADMSTDGVYTITSWTEEPTDAVNGNDTSFRTVENLTEVATFPYVETFDGFSNCGSASVNCIPNGTCVGAFAGGWRQSGADNINWSISNNPTPSTGTGPTADHTSGSGRYLFTEATACDAQSAIAISPCFDLSTTVCPQMSFWYHMYGDDMGTLEVEVFDGFGWVSLWSLSGDQGNLWHEAEVSLSGYVGSTIRVRIVATTGSGVESDIAVDDFAITENGLDLAVTAFNAPLTDCSLGNETVSVTITNNACSSAPSFDINLELNGVVVATETAPAGLGAAASTSFSFPSTVNLSAHETYEFRVWTSLATDGNNENDTLRTAVGSLADLDVPNAGFDPDYCIGASTYFPTPPIPGGTYSGTGIIDATTGEFNPALVGSGSTNITYSIMPTESYYVTSIPHSPVSLSSASVHLLADDASKKVNIGFYFNFFGEYYNQLNLHSNGYVSFGAPGSTSFTPQNIPSAPAPNNLIALAWDDLDPSAGGSIYTKRLGTAPNRRFVIFFDEVPYSGSSAEVKGQLILHESSNEVEMQIFHIESDGGDRTQGIENNNGSEAFTSNPGTNQNDFTQTNKGFLYIPTVCNGSVTETVNVVAGPVVSLGADTAVCFGQTVLLDAGAGFPDYLWSTGDTTQTIVVATTDLYTVEIADPSGLCPGSGSVSVAVADAITIASLVEDVSCFGDSNGEVATLPSGGFGDYSYDWSTGGSSSSIGALGPGTYTVEVTDSVGCSGVDSFTVNEPALLELLSLDSWNETSAGSDGLAIATPMGGTPPYTYFWSNGNTDSLNSGLTAGWYYLTVTDDNGCTLSDSVEIRSNGVGIETPAAFATLEIFPNPSTAVFHVRAALEQPGKVLVEVRDLTGQLLLRDYSFATGPSNELELKLNLEAFAAGSYLLLLRTEKGEQVVRPLAVQR